jgi:hypothetical protein
MLCKAGLPRILYLTNGSHGRSFWPMSWLFISVFFVMKIKKTQIGTCERYSTKKRENMLVNTAAQTTKLNVNLTEKKTQCELFESNSTKSCE